MTKLTPSNSAVNSMMYLYLLHVDGTTLPDEVMDEIQVFFDTLVYNGIPDDVIYTQQVVKEELWHGNYESIKAHYDVKQLFTKKTEDIVMSPKVVELIVQTYLRPIEEGIALSKEEE